MLDIGFQVCYNTHKGRYTTKGKGLKISQGVKMNRIMTASDVTFYLKGLFDQEMTEGKTVELFLLTEDLAKLANRECSGAFLHKVKDSCSDICFSFEYNGIAVSFKLFNSVYSKMLKLQEGPEEFKTSVVQTTHTEGDITFNVVRVVESTL
jgi:hypothetical protein